MKKRHLAGLTMGVLTLLAGLGFLFWTSVPAAPLTEALSALESDSQIVVEYEDSWVFRAAQGATQSTGFLFYPAGNVDPRAYAPFLRQVASLGFTAVLAPMPLNWAVLAPGKADEIMGKFPQHMKWILAGHAQGGASALAFAKDHLDQVEGVVLLASFPPEGLDVSTSSLRVLSIFGEKDGVVTRDRIEKTRHLLPPGTAWVEIKGGNHSQFGWYGPQSGDNLPEITRETQQQTIMGALGPFLKSFP